MAFPLLHLGGLTKAFGPVRALDGVSLDLYPGDIHALVGENGAGKSTLLGILSGVVSPDAGSIEIDGHPASIATPAQAQALGIGTVFQELSLAGALTVAENVFAGRAPTRAGLIRWRELRRLTLSLTTELGIDVNPDTVVDRLPVSTRQLIEIAKALSLHSRILLLDEPTSALTSDEIATLFRLLRRLRERAVGIIYVSHHLPEIFELAGRVSVLRDGRLVAAHAVAETSAERLVQEMVGRELAPVSRSSGSESGSVLLAARGMMHRGLFEGIDVTLRAGEVVGLAGLMGAHRFEVGKALVGLLALHAGSITVRGRAVRLRNLCDAFRHGIAYVPEERKSEGLFLTRSVTENLIVTALRRHSKFGILDWRSGQATAERAIKHYAVKVASTSTLLTHLSGGNQQKVMFAKSLANDPTIIIINEPTKGVDVAAKQEIHAEIRSLARGGKAVLVISSDLPELLAITDRLVVMCRGRITGELRTGVATEEAVMRFASELTSIVGEAA